MRESEGSERVRGVSVLCERERGVSVLCERVRGVRE